MRTRSEAPQQLQLSILPSHIERSDAALERAEAGEATTPAAAPAADTTTATTTPAARSARLQRAKLIGKAVGVGALLLGSGIGIGVALERAIRPRGTTTPSHAPLPGLPFAQPASAPTGRAESLCIAPQYARNATSSAVLLEPSAPGTTTVGARRITVDPYRGPLFDGGFPSPADMDDVLASGNIINNLFGSVGLVRAGVLYQLAETDPQLVKNMVKPLDSSGTAFVVTLFDRDEATNTFLHTDVRVDLDEFNRGDMLGMVNKPVWWTVILQAGKKLDGYLGNQVSTTVSGDRSDAAATRRTAVESLLGTNVEIVSGDELDALRTVEVPVPTSAFSLYDGKDDWMDNDAVKQLASEAGSLSQAITSSLFEAKNDNWPALVRRMQDKRNLCMVTLHKPVDLDLEMQVRSEESLQLPSGASVKTNPSTFGYWPGTRFQPVNFTVPGQPVVRRLTGPDVPYVVVNTEADAVWLKSAPVSYQDTNSTAFKVPTDLLELTAAEITLARRPCEADRGFLFGQQPTLGAL